MVIMMGHTCMCAGQLPVQDLSSRAQAKAPHRMSLAPTSASAFRWLFGLFSRFRTLREMDGCSLESRSDTDTIGPAGSGQKSELFNIEYNGLVAPHCLASV